VLEYSNLLFSGLFVVEMAMKIIAEGPFGYIRCIYNVFDGFIVVLRCILRYVFNFVVIVDSVSFPDHTLMIFYKYLLGLAIS